MSYATLDEVKAHLRYDDDSNDAVLAVYLNASEQAINNYITDEPSPQMLPTLKAATLLLCGYFDNDRNAEKDRQVMPNMSMLPHSVTLLLLPYRTPTAV